MSEITTQEMINKLEILQARTWSFMGLIEAFGDKESPVLARNLAEWQFDAIEFIEVLPISSSNKTNIITLLSEMDLRTSTDYTLNAIDGYLLSIKAILDRIETEDNNEIS